MSKSKDFSVPSAGYSVSVVIKNPNKIGRFLKIIQMIADLEGSLGEVELISSDFRSITRKITISARSEESAQQIIKSLNDSELLELEDWYDDVVKAHESGKLTIDSKTKIRTADDLSRVYTPGVARICKAIAADKSKAYDYTIKNDCVAIVSDGTAVLGLGDIGPEAAMPVMEGKAALFKEFSGLNAFPICLNTKDPAEIIQAVRWMAPTFAAINLEDISAPRCFEIEEALQDLDIPVFHDDQHGTAVVVLAGVYNAVKILDKKLEDLKVVVNGFGAGGVACIKILLEAGVKDIIACDTKGAAYEGRVEGMNPMKEALVKVTNRKKVQGSLADAIKGADMFLGLSQPGVLTRGMVETMKPNPIIFTLANPTPEIFPDEISDIAGVIATGRSDYPNQVNNVLCFPGIIKGAIECRASAISMGMKLAAAQAIADSIATGLLGPDRIIPNVFNRSVADNVSRAVRQRAEEEGLATKKIEYATQKQKKSFLGNLFSRINK